jgi:hypothetical protein
MFGRTLKLAAVLVITQLSTGCCCCCSLRPFFCHAPCGGCCAAPAPACGCTSGYTPPVATAGPMMAPLPTVSVAPTLVPNMPPAAGSAANPIVDRVPFSSANYTHPIR